MEGEDNSGLRVASFAYYLDTAKDNLKTSSTVKQHFGIKFTKPKDQSDQDQTKDVRVDSLSSRPNAAGSDNFVFEVPGPIQDPTSAFTFSHDHDHQTTPKDGEIGVFNADKYFNMKLEYQTHHDHDHESKQRPANLPRVGLNMRPRATPGIMSSESSSWNSQHSALLPDFPLAKAKKASARKIFGCRGPCFDKKSVHINEVVSLQGSYYSSKQLLPSRIGSQRMDLHVLGGDKELKKVVEADHHIHLEDSRPSIEVFGSKNSSKGSDIATNMERKLSMLTWDAIPKGRSSSSTAGATTICDDMASDASSDLFEIENISGSAYPLIASEPADDMSSCMSPTSLYAPSEASIQWSVVTASAADYSTISDYNADEASVSVAGDMVTRKIMNSKSSKTRVEGAKKTGSSGGLLGCKNLKAVDVADHNVCLKSNDPKLRKITS